MISMFKKLYYKWNIACAHQRDDELEKLYRYERARNHTDLRDLYRKLEMVEANSRQHTIRCGPL